MNSDIGHSTVLLAFCGSAPLPRLGRFGALFEGPSKRSAPSAYGIILFGYDAAALAKRKAEAARGTKGDLSTVHLAEGQNLASQAVSLLGHLATAARARGNLEGTQPWLLLDGLPVGLYEAIMACFSPDAAPLFDLARPRPFFVSTVESYREEPFLHRCPGRAIEWQDREFSLALLDEDEKEQLRQALIGRRSVLLTGSRGTGKTLLARFIHFHSPETASGAFVEANLAAIPETLVEQELLGIAPGTATDVRGREGLLHESDGGTLFLDEIAESSGSVQAKLLRLVSERMEPLSYRRLG